MNEDSQNEKAQNSQNSEELSSFNNKKQSLNFDDKMLELNKNIDKYHCQYMIDYINHLLDNYFLNHKNDDSGNHKYTSVAGDQVDEDDELVGYHEDSQNKQVAPAESPSETQYETSITLVPTGPLSGAGLWTLCENCEAMLFNRFLKEKLRVCEECAYHLEMNSQERIELLIDEGTWIPMDEKMFSFDTLDFIDQEPYHQRLEENQDYTGLTDAIQTGTGKLRGYSVALGVMDFQFMGGSMGSVVGEKIARLIQCATANKLPLIIVCASGGARMQEGTLSLMQMAKIAAMLQIHQVQHNLLYISILTSPTTGGVTASFGMLGDIIIAEPNAYIAFAGKRIIEQIFRQEIPEGFQEAESLFKHGLIDLIIPRVLLQGVLAELLALYKLSPSPY